VREAGIYFIFLQVLVHWHSDLRFACSNMTDKKFYLRKTQQSLANPN
jgi:hypothetical protein